MECHRNPMPGDIAALPRIGNSGHVGIFLGRDGAGSDMVMAANSDGVAMSVTHGLNTGVAAMINAAALLRYPPSGPTVYRRYVGP